MGSNEEARKDGTSDFPRQPVSAPVGSWRWQAELVTLTGLGAVMGAAAVVLGAPYWAIVAWRERLR